MNEKNILDRIDNLEKFIDRRIAEMSAEISASVEFMEMNDEDLQSKIKDVQNLISNINQNTDPTSINNGIDMSFIIKTTEDAANNFFTIADEIKTLTMIIEDQDVVKELDNIIMKIFENCGFQDLVGQRVRRIQDQLNLAIDPTAKIQSFNSPDQKITSKDISQDDIDSLFD